MTKLVASLAVLQQVEAGVLSYDDPAIVQKYAPELVKQRILLSYNEETKEAKFADLERPPTLRDLVTHTSGQVYFFFDPKLYAYDRDHGLLAMFGSETGQFAQPFLFSPGTRLAYGTGLDWAGIILERATGQDLESYFRQHIFDPLGLSQNTTFHNTPEVVAKRQHTVFRQPDGSLVLGKPQRPIDVEVKGQLSGGAGLWSTMDDYLLLLRGVLRAKQPGGIVSPFGFELLFKDALPADTPGGPQCHAELSAFLEVLASFSSLEHPASVGHSIACVVNLSDTKGRKAGSGAWGGAANTQWCIDPTTGIGVSLQHGVS